MCDLLNLIAACVLSVYSWSLPQPQYSAGMIYGYGSESVAAANVEWHWPGHSLEGYAGAGASISPHHLGQLMWARVEHGDWIGPILVADVVARRDSVASVYIRREIAELPRGIMAQLGTNWGTEGYIFFGSCPPPSDSIFYTASPYRPPLVWDTPPDDGHKSFYPYPPAALPVDCP